LKNRTAKIHFFSSFPRFQPSGGRGSGLRGLNPVRLFPGSGPGSIPVDNKMTIMKFYL